VLRVHHLTVGAKDLAQSEVFYREVFGFRLVDAFLDSQTKREGLVMVVYNEQDEECAELRFVPLPDSRLPSPPQLTLEVSSSVFERALAAARKYALPVRPFPALDAPASGTGHCEIREQHFEQFFLLDPSGVNIQVLRRLQIN
jgi:catechol 2,3-dioxygenase-like lactoylglutathione lyase family enzyme